MNRIQRYLLTAVCLLSALLAAGADKPLSKKEMRKLAAEMAEAYDPWTEVSLKGKLRLEGLPLSPSVKLYMVRDSLLVMSLSAPFVGEAARIEMDNDSITMVNRMKRTMTRLPMTALYRFFPGSLTDFQDFLLGHVVICGQGPVSPDIVSGLEWYPPVSDPEADDAGEYMLLPVDAWQPEGARYGYVLYEDLTPASLVVEMEDSDDYVQMDYLYDKGGRLTLDVTAAYGRHTVEGELQLDPPSGKVQPIKRVESTAGYTRVPLKQLIRF